MIFCDVFCRSPESSRYHGVNFYLVIDVRVCLRVLTLRRNMFKVNNKDISTTLKGTLNRYLPIRFPEDFAKCFWWRPVIKNLIEFSHKVRLDYFRLCFVLIFNRLQWSWSVYQYPTSNVRFRNQEHFCVEIEAIFLSNN